MIKTIWMKNVGVCTYRLFNSITDNWYNKGAFPKFKKSFKDLRYLEILNMEGKKDE